MKTLLPTPKRDEKAKKKKAIDKSSGKKYNLPIDYNVVRKADKKTGLLRKK